MSEDFPSAAGAVEPLTYRPSARGVNRITRNIRGDFSGWSPSTLVNRQIAQRKPDYLCRIDLCALAAIFLAILTLLLVRTWNFHDLSGYAVDLFKADHSRALPQARREDALEVTVSRDGNTYFGYSRVDLAGLPKEIASGIQDGSERRVYLLVDRRARYADVLSVLSRIREAGITNVSFVTVNRLASRIEMANQEP
jgi:biopolymer transport protein TolR